MANLRDHVKRTLDAREPTRDEAREDLRRVLQRIDRPAPSPGWRVAGALAVVAGAAALVIAVRPSGSPPERAPVLLHASRGDEGPRPIEIYVRKAGEPESAALIVTLNLKGEHR